jgi:hypothetical protein
LHAALQASAQSFFGTKANVLELGHAIDDQMQVFAAERFEQQSFALSNLLIDAGNETDKTRLSI